MAPDTKTTLTIGTLSGSVTREFPSNQKLKVVVDHVVRELHLVGPGPWVIDKAGEPLDLETSIKDASLVDGDVLTLSSQEGGGGSSR